MKNSSSHFRYFLICLIAIVLASCGGRGDDDQSTSTGSGEPPGSASLPQDLAIVLSGPARFAGDAARDAGRKPAEVIEFLGIAPGMNVIDIIAAGGYYTEVLSFAVGAEGRVSAQNPARVLQMRDGANEKQLSERLAGGRLANVSRLDRELAELTPEDGLFDAALTALNLHDIYNNSGEEASIGALKTIAAILEPGAVFGVIDHRGTAGGDNKALHRMRIDDAIRIAAAAGFIVEAQSGLLHVHDDDMTGGVFAEGRRGHTHRFLLRLRKPR